jgi:hypothetical protein
LTNTPSFSLSLSPMAHFRRLELRAVDRPVEHRPGPMAGIDLQTTTLLVWMPDIEARMLLEVDAALARGVTPSFSKQHQRERRLTTTYSSGSARLAISRRIARRLRVRLAAGASAFSWLLTPNPTYTGHRYLTGDIAVSLHMRFPKAATRLHVGLSALPVLQVDVSGGAHGTGSGFGGRAEIRGEWAPFESSRSEAAGRFIVQSSIGYTRFRSRFPASPFDPGGATTVDQSGTLTVGVGYDI